jgi:hypothetical protein
MIRPLQLGEINVLAWNVLDGRIRGFAERQGVAGIGHHTASNGHDNTSGIALDGNRMIWTRKLDLFFFHVSVFDFLLVLSRSGGPLRCTLSVLDIDKLLGRLAAIHKV